MMHSLDKWSGSFFIRHSYLMARSLSINRKLWAFRTNN
ncbi:hypothetical protein UUU_03490 [Klebsiella pneumoniae subsp. pneumoniae DSM 30104 = JCM 1662 = NBRC 14940]|nr:hypothetical protein UUU_03490 [Klebsiella pneumoniae subsp. pneumoniae DSM 30104 = JCM 1662 = NBRC 14940]